MKVLAIEDQLVAAMQLVAVLKSLGHEVEYVLDGTAAWARIAAGGIRVVVCDWRVPGIDGLNLCRRIRERDGDYIYFILISSTPISRGSRAAAIAAGVDDFLAKPANADELDMRLCVAERIIGLTARVERLESFVPMCGYCKKVRAGPEHWQEVEAYFTQRESPRFSPGVCPACYERLMGPQLRKPRVDPASLR